MATSHEPPRKRIATYGKVARKVIPATSQYNTVFFGASSRPQLPPRADTVEVLHSPTAPTRFVAQDQFEVEEGRAERIKSSQKITKQNQKVDVFDVPDDDLPAPPLRKTAPKPLQRAKSSATISTASVFDTPSSDEDIRKITANMQKNTLKSSIRTTRPLSSPQPKPITKPAVAPSAQVKSVSIATNMNGNKKSSTTNSQSPHPSPTPMRQPSHPSRLTEAVSGTALKAKPTKKLENGKVIDLTQRTLPAKRQASPAKSVLLKQAPVIGDAMDIDSTPRRISPKALKLWNDLFESDGPEQSTDRVQHVTVSKKSSPSAKRTLSKPAGILKCTPVKGTSKQIPRKRLIDFLADQESSDSEVDSDASGGSNEMEGIESCHASVTGFSRAPSVALEVPTVTSLNSQNSQSGGPKFVYGEKRTILAEQNQDFMQSLQLEMSSTQESGRRTRRGSIPTLPVLASFHDADIDDEEDSGVKVLNVHELRQAGVNGRFMDELDDLFDRIGKPGDGALSIRRSGLLDLASKLKDKSFVRQFRSNAAETRLFLALGQETDVIAGFILVSMIVLLFTEGSLPHAVTQLRQQGIARLLLRLLENKTSVVAISKLRTSNMSKIAQSDVAEYHAYLLQAPIWEHLKPECITPRVMAVKCLESMVRQSREAGIVDEIFSKDLMKHLFEILKSASDDSIWKTTTSKGAAEFYLALSALESHSITAKAVTNESPWTMDFLPVIADVLQTALSQPEFGDAQLLILRLALNVTNNNHQGADVFARPALLAVMGQTIVARFRKITRFLAEAEFFAVLDHLVLTIGVMINFAEWSMPAREALQSLEGRSDDPLDRMAQLFLDNRELMAEVSCASSQGIFQKIFQKMVFEMLTIV